MATVYGDEDQDYLTVDGRSSDDDQVNNLGYAKVRWSGCSGSGLLHAYFTPAGSSVIDVFDDHSGEDTVQTALISPAWC